MNKLNLVCVFAALFNCILAGDVRTLTDNNFQDLISNEPVALVKFFAPWYVTDCVVLTTSYI